MNGIRQIFLLISDKIGCTVGCAIRLQLLANAGINAWFTQRINNVSVVWAAHQIGIKNNENESEAHKNDEK